MTEHEKPHYMTYDESRQSAFIGLLILGRTPEQARAEMAAADKARQNGGWND